MEQLQQEWQPGPQDSRHLGQIHPPRAASASTHSPLRLLKQLAQKRMLQPGFVHTMDAFRAGWRHQWLRGKARQSALQRRRRRRRRLAREVTRANRVVVALPLRKRPPAHACRTPRATSARTKTTRQEPWCCPCRSARASWASSAPRQRRTPAWPPCFACAVCRDAAASQVSSQARAGGPIRVAARGEVRDRTRLVSAHFSAQGYDPASLASKRAHATSSRQRQMQYLQHISITHSAPVRCAAHRRLTRRSRHPRGRAPACAGWLPRARAARPAAAP
jgi:hypothetical protein